MSTIHPLDIGEWQQHQKYNTHYWRKVSSCRQSWTQQLELKFNPTTTQRERNVTTKAFHLQYIGFLTFLRDLGTIIGASLFSVGAILGFSLAYGYFPLGWTKICQLLQSVITLCGAMFFTVTPAANFILSNAKSHPDKALSWEINMYMLGGFCFFLGAIVYAPFSFIPSTHHLNHTMGASLYLMGSVMYVLVTAWGIHRLLQRKTGCCQPSSTACLVSSWVSGLYFFGAFMFLAGSVFLFPAYFTPYCYAMFLAGEQCFIVGSVMTLLSRQWSFRKHTIMRGMKFFVRDLMMTACDQQLLFMKWWYHWSNLLHSLWQYIFSWTPDSK